MSAGSFGDFLAMGGYAAYVWPAYAVFFVVLVADFLAPRWRRRRNLRELNARLARQTARQQRQGPQTALTAGSPDGSPQETP